jgi:hypothetical protein
LAGEPKAAQVLAVFFGVWTAWFRRDARCESGAARPLAPVEGGVLMPGETLALDHDGGDC